MKLSGSEVLFPEYATPSEASANSPRGSVLICANPVFVLIPPRRPRPVSVVQHPAFVDAPSPQFRKDLRYPQKPSSGRWLRRGQRFFRNWALGAEAAAGIANTDTGRNITGNVNFNNLGVPYLYEAFYPLSGDNNGGEPSVTPKGWASNFAFDASRVWKEHSGQEFAPVHVWQPAILYLGRPAQV